MTRPVFVTSPDALRDARSGSRLVLDGPEGRHAAVVRRIGPGEQVDLVDGVGLRAIAEVLAAGHDGLEVAVVDVIEELPPAPRFVLVQALAKGDRDDQAIEAATELGVDAIVPWQAQRSIVQWRGDRGRRSHGKWVDLVRAAAKQSRRARFPEVEPLVDRSGLVRRIEQATVAYVLHEEATEPLATAELPPEGEVLLIVGPEGGIAPEELTAFTEAGARTVRIGHTVLRSSSAGPAALAVLSARERWR